MAERNRGMCGNRQVQWLFETAGGLVTLLVLACGTVIAQQWVAQAPGPNTHGQVEHIEDGEVVGAINSVAAHPTNPNIVYVGSVNGGIWKTANATASRPVWVPQTDNQVILSVGCIEFDPTDVAGQTLVAGMGCFSNFGGCGGGGTGLLRTTDGGTNWSPIDGGGVLRGFDIVGVAPRGATIVIAVNNAANPARVGIWRSTDTGATWAQISGGSSTGLPGGMCADLASDQSNRERLFTNAGPNGLFRSNNAGATWAKVSNAEIDSLIALAENLKISVGMSNNVYVAIVRAGQLAGVFRSGDGGTSWTSMGIPTTAEGGIHPGGQGGTNLSLMADPDNDSLVYVGGDRQPKGLSGFFPNSIGARDYSGRLFRGTASPTGGTWVHLTHSRVAGLPGSGTASESAPHADSRDMAFRADKVLIEVNDGGIYCRTTPRTDAGDWFSMNGNVQTTEFHSVAWDSNSHVVIGGAQDTGIPEQSLRSNVKWRSVDTADGGTVAVDDSSTPGLSTRYSSTQFLGGLRRQIFNAANAFQSEVFLAKTILGSGTPLVPQFYTPIKLNAVAPKRLIIGAKALYESLDKGDTVVQLAPAIQVNETGANIIAYGARGNPDVLYVGSGSRVFVRTGASPGTLTQATAYSGGFVVGIAIDPNAANTAYVADSVRVFRTTNSGQTWTAITANLATLAPGNLRTVAFVTATPGGAVVVGSDNGVFQATGPTFSTWSRLGMGLPRAPVLHLEYDPVDGILLAGTQGRGAWTLALPALVPPPAPPTARLITGRAASSGPDTFSVMRLISRSSSMPQRGNRPDSRARAGAPPESVSTGPFQLRPGILVNPQQRRAYVMNAAGGIDAVDLTNGQPVWDSKAAAKPIAMVGQQLITQAESGIEGNRLNVVVLDATNGSRKITVERTLSPSVRASVVETERGQFEMAVRPSQTEAVISWQYRERAVKGVRPGTRSMLSPPEGTNPPGRPPDAEAGAQNGAFKLNLTTGAVAPAVVLETTPLNDRRVLMLSEAERIPALPETQFLSADSRHVMVSEVVGDDQVWEKYRLTIYERGTGQRLGEFRSHLSLMPFFVMGSTVVFETGPYTRATGADLVPEPAKIRAVDLNTNRELWSHQVRETTYRGSFPP